jgi:glyoxylase I family protein
MEVLGLDHLYLAVSDLTRAEDFYDRALAVLGFRKCDKTIGGDPHRHYFNRVMQVSIRPARTDIAHDCYAPGLHHISLQLAGPTEVDEAVRALREVGVAADEAKRYPEYNPDYYATFFEDPDGIRWELVGRTPYRDALVRHWDDFRVVVNPLAEYLERTKQ